jgi:hypothetical protein
MDGVSVDVLGALTPGALLGLGLLFILIGRLIPLRSHLRELDAANRRALEWQEAYRAECARADSYAQQLAEVLGVIRRFDREGAP